LHIYIYVRICISRYRCTYIYIYAIAEYQYSIYMLLCGASPIPSGSATPPASTAGQMRPRCRSMHMWVPSPNMSSCAHGHPIPGQLHGFGICIGGWGDGGLHGFYVISLEVTRICMRACVRTACMPSQIRGKYCYVWFPFFLFCLAWLSLFLFGVAWLSLFASPWLLVSRSRLTSNETNSNQFKSNVIK